MLWRNVLRTVKRNSKKRDKDAHSGTKCDGKKLFRHKIIDKVYQNAWMDIEGGRAGERSRK